MRTCVCRAHSPISESVQSLPYSAPARGFPSPSSEIPARPLPTLPRRESGRAGDKETPASLHSPSFYPPETLPGALPRPQRHRARTHQGKGPGGQGAGWASPLSPRRAATAARAPRPGTPLGSRAPIIHSPKRPEPLTLPSPAQTSRTIPPAERQGGAAHTKRMGSAEPAGRKRSRRGSRHRPGAAIYPISSSISEMSAKMRKTTSSVSAASIQLRNCSCMVGSAPSGTRARAGARSWGWRSLRAPRAAGHTPCTLGESGPAAAEATAAASDRQGLLRRGEPARSLSCPPLPSPPSSSSPLPSPRPAPGSRRSLTALLRASPGLLPLTPAASQLPRRLPPGRDQGARHS